MSAWGRGGAPRRRKGPPRRQEPALKRPPLTSPCLPPPPPRPPPPPSAPCCRPPWSRSCASPRCAASLVAQPFPQRPLCCTRGLGLSTQAAPAPSVHGVNQVWSSKAPPPPSTLTPLSTTPPPPPPQAHSRGKEEYAHGVVGDLLEQFASVEEKFQQAGATEQEMIDALRKAYSNNHQVGGVEVEVEVGGVSMRGWGWGLVEGPVEPGPLDQQLSSLGLDSASSTVKGRSTGSTGRGPTQRIAVKSPRPPHPPPSRPCSPSQGGA